MPGQTISIPATEGGEFDCCLATPEAGGAAPAVALACSIDGVDADLRQIADDLAAAGFVVAAPDLFWRTMPGPLSSGDPRVHERSQPRLEKIAIPIRLRRCAPSARRRGRLRRASLVRGSRRHVRGHRDARSPQNGY